MSSIFIALSCFIGFHLILINSEAIAIGNPVRSNKGNVKIYINIFPAGQCILSLSRKTLIAPISKNPKYELKSVPRSFDMTEKRSVCTEKVPRIKVVIGYMSERIAEKSAFGNA